MMKYCFIFFTLLAIASAARFGEKCSSDSDCSQSNQYCYKPKVYDPECTDGYTCACKSGYTYISRESACLASMFTF